MNDRPGMGHAIHKCVHARISANAENRNTMIAERANLTDSSMINFSTFDLLMFFDAFPKHLSGEV